MEAIILTHPSISTELISTYQNNFKSIEETSKDLNNQINLKLKQIYEKANYDVPSDKSRKIKIIDIKYSVCHNKNLSAYCHTALIIYTITT